MVMASSGAGLTAAQKALIAGSEQVANKNASNGYPGLTGGELVGTLIGRHGTRAALLTQILRAGEIATTDDTHEFFIGDDVTLGGLNPAISLNSPWNIIVGATGTPNYNGDALRAAYTQAKTYTPNGGAISVLNPVNIFAMPGVFTPTAAMTFDTAGINVIGLGGSRNTIFQATNGGLAWSQSNAGMVLSGITFRSVSGTGIAFTLNLPNLTLGGANYHNDLVFDVSSNANNCMTVGTGGTPVLYGTYRKCFSLGKQMYGGTGFTIDPTVLFDDCECGDIGLGAKSSSVALPNPFSGTVRRCRYNGPTWAVQLQPGSLVEHCRFACGILRFTGSGARIVYTSILPASGTCIGNATDTASVIATHNNLRTFTGNTPFGTNITNLIATPYNVQDNNL